MRGRGDLKSLCVSHSPSSLVLELAVLPLQTLSRRMSELSDLFGKLLMGRGQLSSLKSRIIHIWVFYSKRGNRPGNSDYLTALACMPVQGKKWTIST